MDTTRRHIAIDFEYASSTPGTICAYGLAFEDGTKEHGFVRLHPSAPEQRNTRYHGISQEQTDGGMAFATLYERIKDLTAAEDTFLVAHDLKSDRRAWHAAVALFGLEPLPLIWIDSLPIARAEVAANGGGLTGVAAMAQRYGLTINHHNPADDAFVSLQVVLRNPPTKIIVDDASQGLPGSKGKRR